ncbi:hypothetical protein KI387_041847, partial [Taxus chinensis]
RGVGEVKVSWRESRGRAARGRAESVLDAQTPKKVPRRLSAKSCGVKAREPETKACARERGADRGAVTTPKAAGNCEQVVEL